MLGVCITGGSEQLKWQITICYALINLAMLLSAACSLPGQALHTLYSKFELLCCAALPCPVLYCVVLCCALLHRGFRARAIDRAAADLGIAACLTYTAVRSMSCAVVMCRGRRAIEEATQRLTRAMDRADADLGRAHRSRRGSSGVGPGNEGYPTNGHKDDEGVHKLGRTAEQDYDRCTCQPTMGDSVCVYSPTGLSKLLQCSRVMLPGCFLYHMVKFTFITNIYSHPKHLNCSDWKHS